MPKQGNTRKRGSRHPSSRQTIRKLKKTYTHDLHPHDWFKSLSDHPKLLNPMVESLTDNAAQPNPFDERKRWTVIEDNPPDASWHETTWSQDSSEFVNELTIGDRIVLIVRALSPGWLTIVFNAKIEIYYSLPVSQDSQ